MLNTKATGLMISNMVKELRHGENLVAHRLLTLEISTKVRKMEREGLIGRMVLTMKETSLMVTSRIR